MLSCLIWKPIYAVQYDKLRCKLILPQCQSQSLQWEAKLCTFPTVLPCPFCWFFCCCFYQIWGLDKDCYKLIRTFPRLTWDLHSWYSLTLWTIQLSNIKTSSSQSIQLPWDQTITSKVDVIKIKQISPFMHRPCKQPCISISKIQVENIYLNVESNANIRTWNKVNRKSSKVYVGIVEDLSSSIATFSSFCLIRVFIVSSFMTRGIAPSMT